MSFFSNKKPVYQKMFFKVSGDEYGKIQDLLDAGWEIETMSAYGFSKGSTGQFGIINGYEGCYVYLRKEINN